MYGHEIVDYLFLTLLTYTLDVQWVDVVGHMKLVNGQSIIETPVPDEVEIARARHVLVHVQSHEYVFLISYTRLLSTSINHSVTIFCSGPVMKLYLWDQAARDFCKKFKSYEGTPTVLLVTTVNTKSLGGSISNFRKLSYI